MPGGQQGEPDIELITGFDEYREVAEEKAGIRELRMRVIADIRDTLGSLKGLEQLIVDLEDRWLTRRN